jgi:hypothetical protein
MTLLTREAIQQKTALEMVEVDVSEWGAINHETGERERTTVFVREMTAREKDKWEDALVNRKGKKIQTNLANLRARLVVATACDADGNLIFRPEDVEYLTEKPVKVLERLCAAAQKLNNVSEDDEEELVKN